MVPQIAHKPKQLKHIHNYDIYVLICGKQTNQPTVSSRYYNVRIVSYEFNIKKNVCLRESSTARRYWQQRRRRRWLVRTHFHIIQYTAYYLKKPQIDKQTFFFQFNRHTCQTALNCCRVLVAYERFRSEKYKYSFTMMIRLAVCLSDGQEHPLTHSLSLVSSSNPLLKFKQDQFFFLRQKFICLINNGIFL